MRNGKRYVAIAILLALPIGGLRAEENDDLASWRDGVRVENVAPHADRHVIHSYFNTSPESPDGKYVLYFTSTAASGESGEIRILERRTGQEALLAENVTTEDAHRVACQQWSNGGQQVVYHDCRDGRWFVIAVDIATNKEKVLAEDRQVGFGSPASPWVPIYGCHWKPGPYRDLQLVHVVTGEIKTIVTAADVIGAYGDWTKEQFGGDNISIFFPVMSPDGNRIFFKLSRPSGGDDFRSSKASYRQGKVVYDLPQQRLVQLFKTWGHPSWSPDSQQIFEKGNVTVDIATGKTKRNAPSCISDHPSISPQGDLFVTDADVTKRKYGEPGDWAIAVGSMTRDDFVLIDIFGNTKGAKSWRHNHPHPAFSADGQRIYYNVNEGTWTTLRVASQSKSDPAPTKP
ncbi:hypothetical protein LOC68_10920 [Blastopirellula sp. JC732]|uniref:Biopolymer transporter Tol n=1 Tax=Blastopirellula sediminis TaxID=2894196 RepID=A0A9X1MN24_9BACT|nr:hypothetical protein [Blastopirellula sediminis]MCC9608311.1 hypothetical protein [Blastopirellula sediminis]MCC9628912.1 hypothetical protein [Blastopirellula sediminis]